jgi:anaerobic magnesium-protoporphyrin IX monomethyl ester cyclase
MNKILLFNPLSAVAKHRIPNSILNIAASVEGQYEWVIVDGNCETDPLKKIEDYIENHQVKYIGVTVMPGPQLKQATPVSKAIKAKFPDVKIIWGGYFPSTQADTVLCSGYVDFVINGPGDHAFPLLIDALENNTPFEFIKNIIYKTDRGIIKNGKEDLIDQESLPPLPYDKLANFYPIEKYLGRTYLVQKTLAYH